MDFKALFLTYDGRLNRQPYWIGIIILAVINVVLRAVFGLIGGEHAIATLLSVIVSVALIYPSICIGIKRCHDRDRSGWFQLIALIPLIGGIWLFVELGCLRGTVGPNRFGPDPLDMVGIPLRA